MLCALGLVDERGGKVVVEFCCGRGFDVVVLLLLLVLVLAFWWRVLEDEEEDAC
jgi:hypothetical protein